MDQVHPASCWRCSEPCRGAIDRGCPVQRMCTCPSCLNSHLLCCRIALAQNTCKIESGRSYGNRTGSLYPKVHRNLLWATQYRIACTIFAGNSDGAVVCVGNERRQERSCYRHCGRFLPLQCTCCRCSCKPCTTDCRCFRGIPYQDATACIGDGNGLRRRIRLANNTIE